ncbi:putative mitochondrial carrier protein [Teratosphaeria nubilosa]|uniref:Mitochondrial glycine transporter n=1 Tax=Teratosphaeria nubilosa TaxID=161662 RepID=A0A6G1LGJ8_9PEZI|nr:putative mitochondrial carrier protein [Teratosphaeria nubilosa]
MSNGGQKQKASSAFHLIAGLGSGAASAFLLQPADLLKTRVQQSHASASLTSAFREILNGPNPIRSLWRGVVPSVIRTGCGSALYFGMLNQMRQYAAKLPPVPVIAGELRESGSSSSALPKLGNVANLTTGALSRVAAGFAMNPVTVLKVRYESTQYAYTSLVGAGRDIVTKEGMRGFFAGFGATAVRDAPYAGLYVVIYEQAKANLSRFSSPSSDGQNKGSNFLSNSASINFASGVIAAVSATAVTNPFDAIKTRLQLAPGRYGNTFRAASMMVRQEGVGSLFSGLSMRIGRKALSSAFTWTVYEELIRRAERVLV